MNYYQYSDMDDMNTLILKFLILLKLCLVGGVVALCATGSMIKLSVKEGHTGHWVLPSWEPIASRFSQCVA